MKTLIADKFEKVGLQMLQDVGCEVEFDPHLSGDSLVSALKEHDPEILVVRSTRVEKEAIEAGKSLNLIIRAGAGFNTIDVATASARSVFVANCPGMNSAAVAELVFGLMLSLDRRIAHNVNDLREGSWNKAEYAKARGLKGGTLGIVGLGNVGKEVARRALAFDMRIIYFDVVDHPEFEQECPIERTSLEDLLTQSDFVTLHVPLAKGTKHLIDESKLRIMKPSAQIINTSRGEVIDQQALVKALSGGWIAGAGLDVYEQEPPNAKGEFTDPLAKFKELYGTHHIGASTEQAQTAVAEEVVRIVKTYNETGQVLNCVNREKAAVAKQVLVIRHFNKPGVLAHVLGHLNEVNINVLEMNNVVLTGGVSCCAYISINDAPPPGLISKIEEHDLVVSAKTFVMS
jgi:D-3-phosphoglycerate dehydrogenase